MPGWPGGLGNRLQDGRAAVDQGLGDRLQNWWNSTTFFKPTWDDLVGGLTAPGDVMSGAQPTMAADPQTGEFHTDPRLMDRAGALAGAVTLGAGAIPAEADALRMGIKAYHGSPHDFERFDSSKIGTGEGAQAYGHGLYLAENEAVAKEYKRPGPHSHIVPTTIDGVPASQFRAGNAVEKRAVDALSRNPTIDEAIKYLQQDSGTEAAQAWLTKNANRIKDANATGRMYEVDIAADPEQFIDFDAPLSAQPPAARDKLESHQRYRVEQAGPNTWNVLHPGGWVPNAAKNFYRSEEAANKAAEQLNQSRTVADLVPRTAEQAKALQEAGIPGIRYLDQGSRGAAIIYNVGSKRADFGPYSPYTNRADAEEQLKLLRRMGETDAEIKEQVQPQSRNYVVFPGNEHLIAILKKYGLPISAAGLAALSQLHPQEAQAAPLGDRLQRGK